jgi:uncharacterized membrane protein YesL
LIAALRHLNQRGYIYIWANFLCVVCSLPIVTAPAAWAGLVKMSYLAHTGPRADLNDFWDGFRENLRNSVILTLLSLLIYGINLTNLTSYSGQTGVFYDLMRVVWIGAMLLWSGVMVYLYPIYYHMERPTLRGALRNALLMIVLHPFFSLGLWLVWVIISAISTFFFAAWLLLTVSMLAVIATRSVLTHLQVTIYTPPELLES